MTEQSRMREEITRFAKSIYDRGLTSGSTGNISARLSDGTILMTPTGSSMGFLDPAQISHLSEDLRLLSGDAPTKEIRLHTAFYEMLCDVFKGRYSKYGSYKTILTDFLSRIFMLKKK